jgi:hypothetical protein
MVILGGVWREGGREGGGGGSTKEFGRKGGVVGIRQQALSGLCLHFVKA